MTPGEATFLVIFGAVMNVLLAAAIGWTTWAAAQGRLKSNVLAGIRTWETTRDEKAWRAAHRAAWPLARFMTMICLGSIPLALALLLSGLRVPAAVVTIIPTVAVLALVWPLLKVANEAGREASPRPLDRR